MVNRSLKIFAWLVLGLAFLTALFMQQRPFGKLPSGDRLQRILRSRNYDNGIFNNLHETQLIAEGASYTSMTYKFFFSKGVEREPGSPLPVIKTDLKTLSQEPELIWFGHSSYLIAAGGKRILADPVFSERASPVQYAGSKAYPGTMAYGADDFPDLDLVIISHDHYDHLDYNTIVKIADRTKMFAVPLGVGEHLEHWGVPASKIREFDWWEGEEIVDGIKITCTPARHFSGRGFRRNKTLWASFVVQTAGLKIFVGGDSGYDDSFKKIGEHFGPFDIAMVECGQYDPQWPQIHMTPEETIHAAADLKTKMLLPVHWGKFTLALHPWREPIQRALAEAKRLNIPVTTPQIGEPVLIPTHYPDNQWWNP